MHQRNGLPQRTATAFLMGGDIERCLSLHEGVDLPQVAAFDMLRHATGRSALTRYFSRHAQLARTYGMGLLLEAPTARANADWGAILGYDADELTAARQAAIDLLVEVRGSYKTADTPIIVSGTIGPRTDGYNAALRMSSYEAAHYHAPALQFFANSEADQVAAHAMNYAEEASGIALVAAAYGLPLAIAFKPGPSGRLLSGDSLAEAIARIDRETLYYPAYYMIECSHAAQLPELLSDAAQSILQRIRGVRIASCSSVDPDTIGTLYRTASAILPNLSLIGAQLDYLLEQTLSQPYSSEFVIAAARGKSGPALMRSSGTAEQEGAALFS